MPRLLSLIGFFLIASLSAKRTETQSLNLWPRTKAIYQRYYFIKRLKEPFHSIEKLENAQILNSDLIGSLKDSASHPAIKECLSKVSALHHLGPIRTLWKKFITYNKIMDSSLNTELAKLIFIILKSAHREGLFEGAKELISKKSSPVPVELIILRFFLIKRLNQSIYLLEKYKNTHLNDVSSIEAELPHIDDPQVRKVLASIINSRTIEPFFHLWNDFRYFHRVNEIGFPKNIIMLILMCKCLTDGHSGSHFATLAHECGHMYSKKIKDLLAMLDNKVTMISSENKIDEQASIVMNELDVGTEHLAYLVFKRYYLIQRLVRAINFLINIDSEKISHCFTHNTLDIQCIFSHQEIIESFQAIRKQKNLEPLFNVWNQFNTYRFLDDDLLVEEFSREVFILVVFLINHTKTYSQLPEVSKTSLMQILDLLDMLIEKVDSSQTKNLDDLGDITPEININVVMERYYCIKRLKNIMPQSLTFPMHVETISQLGEYASQEVNKCASKIISKKSLEPLFKTWKQIEHYKDINDPTLIRDFIRLVLVIYGKVLEYLNSNNAIENEKFAQFKELYAKLDNLDIEEILDIVTLVSTEIPHIIETYELNGTISWRQWISKYWWAPPLVLGSILLKIIINHQVKYANQPTAP